MSSQFSTKRLQKELAKMHDGFPPGISIHSASDFSQWQMDIRVLDDNPIYKGETYRLNFKFSNSYPIGALGKERLTTTVNIEAPEVTFVTAPGIKIPMHPHVYSNGVICLDLLSSGSGWSPVQSVESVCMSIQSMLTGNSRNERPEGDAEFVRRGYRSPKNIRFIYDDPTV